MQRFDPSTIRLYHPSPTSHKGQNGKLLVIGGSKLFHSSIFWSADVASKIVDLVHFTSPANENNDLVRKRIKEGFWNGIVVDWGDVESYIEEDDCVLIGPGMIRSNETKQIVDYLLSKYPSKKWVVDGGALQEVNIQLITDTVILTPHHREFERILKRTVLPVPEGPSLTDEQMCVALSTQLGNSTILLKGPRDIVCQRNHCAEILGGNSGMTKGGTGDVLAGLVAALYCKNDPWISATIGSWVNKRAGDVLYRRVGPYFNAQDLINEIPRILWGIQAT